MTADRTDPTPDRRDSDGIAKPPLCDELSGGGGSATDTRDRGVSSGRPSGIKGDCTPIPVHRPDGGR